MATTTRRQWKFAGERLAARARDQSGAVWRRVASVRAGALRLWRSVRFGVAVAALLLVVAMLIVGLRDQAPGVPPLRIVQEWRDYTLLLVEAVVLLMVLGLLLVVVLWLLRTEPAVISPFANATTSAGLTAVSDLLAGHLDRISSVQNTPIADIPGERLRTDPVQPKPETVDTSLANVGSINVGHATISIGQVLIAVKRMLPARGRGTTITGSVQRYGSTLQIVATVQRGRLMNSVMVEGDAATPDDDGPILTLVPELAYRIHFALARDRMAAGTWQLLRSFTEARAAYQRYLNGGVVEDREQALSLTADAYALNCTYPRLFGLLYGLGTCFFGTGDYAMSIELFHTALAIEPHHPQALVQLARCHYALEQDDDVLRVLRQALDQPRSHPAARYMMGLAYGTIELRDKAIAELLRVPRRPRSLRSSAWVTIAGLRLQEGDVAGHERALGHVAGRDFADDPYSRACWLSVKQDHDGAIDALREAFWKRLMPVEYARRDPDLVFIRDRCSLEQLRDRVGLFGTRTPTGVATSRAATPDPFGRNGQTGELTQRGGEGGSLRAPAGAAL
jgi:tetratricopeptide (TPR) repeat protein